MKNTNKKTTLMKSLVLASVMALPMISISPASAQTYNGGYNVNSNSDVQTYQRPYRNRHAMSQNEIGSQYYLYIEGSNRRAIQDFFMNAPDFKEGSVIRFVVDALPYSRVNVTFTSSNNLVKNIALSETEAGHYTGSYTIRRTDMLSDTAFTAKVRKGSTTSTAQLIPPQGGVKTSSSAWTAPEARPYYNNNNNNNNVNSRDYMNRDYGVVRSVEVQQTNAEGINVPGSVIGAVVGGVVGSQIGGGSGQKAATILGALGGGYAGNKIGQSQSKDSVWLVTVDFNDRTSQTYSFTQDPALVAGSTVRRENSTLIKR